MVVWLLEIYPSGFPYFVWESARAYWGCGGADGVGIADVSANYVFSDFEAASTCAINSEAEMLSAVANLSMVVIVGWR